MSSVVQVLLATFNGAQFVREQVESVLNQQGVQVQILARDDGSNDGTMELLQEFERADPGRFTVLRDGEKSGSARGNFARLLLAADGDYIAFCDQDDVWLPGKLSTTLQALQQLESAHPPGVPALVYTDLRVVDGSLRTTNPSLWEANGLAHPAAPSFASLLSENVVTGCTALFNRPLLQLLRPLPPAALMHDHWAALVAASTGVMAAVAQQTVLYRQHGGNVIGAVGHRSAWKRAARLVSREGAAARHSQYLLARQQAVALQAAHAGRMLPAAQDTLSAFIALEHESPLRRMATLSKRGLWRGGTQRKLAQFLDLFGRSH